MPPGRLRSPPAAPGPRSRASVPDALPAAARRAGRRSWRRTRSGPCPRRRRPAAGRRPDPCGRGGGTHRRDLRRPKGPKSPSWPPASSTCMVNSPIRFMALSSSGLHRIALALLERGVDPPIAFSRHCSSREDIYANCRDRSCTRLVTQKPQNDLTLARHRPSLAKSQRACGKAWPGENVDKPSSPAFTTGPSTATFFSKLSVMFRSSLDTSIKPILCPRKSGRLRLNNSNRM